MSIWKVIKHPVFVFVACQIVWIAILLLWVLWSVDLMNTFQQINLKRLEGIDNQGTITVLVVGCILLGMLLVGSVMLFIFGQKQSQLFRAQQSFMSSVTHELRSPLASLKLTFDTLEKRKLPQEMHKQIISNAGKDIERLSRLVNQVLITARLDRGIAAFADENTETLKLKNLIASIVDRTKWLDAELSERLTIDISDGLEVRVSRFAITLVLTNLIENAIKYSEPKTPIFVRAAGAGNCRLQISVTDQGYGLEKNEKRKIFKLFHRGPTASTKAIPGTGVGLFLVKNILKIIGGSVEVDSGGPNQGSTFTISLPQKDLRPIES